jgi:hypothetical protein
MASITTMTPSLPSKKRKPSYGSSVEDKSEASSGVRLRKDSEQDASTSTTNSSANKGHHHSIADKRLPSKKRKGSHEFVTSDGKRRRDGSQDLSVSFGDLQGSHECAAADGQRRRKGSQDLPVSFEDLQGSHECLAAGSSQDLPVSFEDLQGSNGFVAARKGSQDLSVSFENLQGSHEFVAADSQRGRKGSQDLSVSFEDLQSSHEVVAADGQKSRNESQDLSMSFEDLPRKGSIDSTWMLEPLPRKLSNDASVKLDDLMIAAEASSSLERVLPEACAAAARGTLSALEHLDALGTDAEDDSKPAARSRRNSEADDISSTASSGQRLLFEAIMMTNEEDEESWGGGRGRLESWVRPADESVARDRSDSWGIREESVARDRSDSWGGGRGRLESWVRPADESVERDRSDSWGIREESVARDRSESWGALRLGDLGRDRVESWTGGIPRLGGDQGRDRVESWGGIRGRDRLESWGGMSDLSVLMDTASASTAAHIAMAASAIQQLPVEDLPSIEMPDPVMLEDSKPSALPSKISLDRDRLNTIGSLSEMSLSNLPLLLDGADMHGDIQAYVAAAMAGVGDQLADLAYSLEHVAKKPDSTILDAIKKDIGLDASGDDGSSAASPMIGAVSDSARGRRRPRTWSTGSGMISVDLEAVQAAVHAAEIATASGALDAYADLPSGADSASSSSRQQSSTRQKRRLPTIRARGESIHSAASEDVAGISKQEMQLIRERARVAAGYIPSLSATSSAAADVAAPVTKKQRFPPSKKRTKRSTPEPENVGLLSTVSSVHTPKISNARTCKPPPNTPYFPSSSATAALPDVPPSSPSAASRTPRGQASQKWESMFDCLLEFIDERKEEDAKDLSEEDMKTWIWDGNVPTNFKTTPGKALGRWVNNQRSAKSKGTLKDEREQRLVDSGLRWSVLAAGSWNHMLEELKIYIREQTHNGRKWDGNVPTSYQIKTRENSPFAGEDKNLGRWVNRQRSLYQSGKLRKERQLGLEAIGLKWSMLATMSWDSMCDTLHAYVRQQEKEHREWDGNVPANFKTNDNPPRALGRWINRQRSSFQKNKLKKEYVDKLNTIGLKWSVHHRQGEGEDLDEEDDEPELSNAETNKEASKEQAGPDENGKVDSKDTKKDDSNGPDTVPSNAAPDSAPSSAAPDSAPSGAV